MSLQAKHQRAAQGTPPGWFFDTVNADFAAAVFNQQRESFAQMSVETAVPDDDIGLQIERQAERVEAARTHRGPQVVGQRYFAVQWSFVMSKNTCTGCCQMVVQQAGGDLDIRHVGFALQDQADLHPTPGGPAERPEQQITGGKVGVGNDYLMGC